MESGHVGCNFYYISSHRDLLLDKYPNDVDLATTANSDEMQDILADTEITCKQFNNPAHQTVLAIFPNDEKYEITTLKWDVHKSYNLSRSNWWARDAFNRDFTINSMSLDKNGNVYDYCGGQQDLMDRRVTFVSSPTLSITADPGRILRYFR